MYQQIPKLPEGVFGIKASGKVDRSAIDYVVERFIASNEAAPIRMLLLEISDSFEVGGGGVFSRYDNWLSLMNVEAVALVGSKKWEEELLTLASAIKAFHRRFDPENRDEAIKWLGERRN